MPIYSKEPYNILQDANFWWWEGIIAPRQFWSTDSQEEGITSPTELENWGKRVKVRIQGIHPPSKSLLPDDQLPWAEVRMNSAGSGHKGTGLSIGVTQGSRVYGIWENPLTKSGPIILGILGNNEEIDLPKVQPNGDGFVAYSGYTNQDIVAGYDMPLSQGKPLETMFNPNLWGLSDKWMMQENFFGISSPTDCEKVPLNSIMKSMQDLIQKIEKAQNQMKEWQNAAQGWIDQRQEWIRAKVKEATEFITGGLKWLFKEIRKWTEEEINRRTKKLYELINPPDRDKAKLGHDALMELITCLFNKLIANLKKMVGNFLGQMLDRYINVPACAVQNFISSLLGNTLGAVSSAIDSIISSVSDLIGGVFSLADSILGLLKAIAGFFACEEDQECPDTKEWNIFEGGKPSAVFDIDSILNNAKSVSGKAKNIIDQGGDLITTAANAVDFSNLINSATNTLNSCNIGPLFCGPPKVTFWGGGGSGAVGNAIISASGDLLGVDLISSGTGYTKPPSISIEDSCGKGSGASAIAIMEKERPSDGGGGSNDNGTGGGTNGSIGGQNNNNNDLTFTGEETYRVIAVVIDNPGDGYLSRPNGDIGGDGRVWSPKENTVVKTPDGKWEQYRPGEPIPEREGDIIIKPEDRRIIDGAIVDDETGDGGGLINPIGPGGDAIPGFDGGYGDIPQDISIDDKIGIIRNISRIPGTGANGATEFDAFPSINIGSYPTILYLCDLYVKNRGINYSPGDEVVIEPNFGAKVEVNFGPFGTVESLKIMDSGNGFVETPRIYIKSETGYNAEIYPIFCISNIGNDTEGKELTFEERQKVVTIVDCVGKFN